MAIAHLGSRHLLRSANFLTSRAVRENTRHLFAMLCLAIKVHKHSTIYFSISLGVFASVLLFFIFY